MSIFSPAEIVRRVLDEPLVRPAHIQWQRRQFLSREGYGAHFGVFNGFDAARASLPRSPEFDYTALAAEYVDVRSKKIFAYDYPVMWTTQAAWARKSNAENRQRRGLGGLRYRLP